MTKDIRKLIEKHKSIRLDLGCGENPQEGFLGVDKVKYPKVDIVHDLEKFPWPFLDNCARAVVMSHFWEHIKPWLTLDFMKELHRVCQNGAQVMIASPYGTEFRFVQDPTHCNPSNEATFLYWDNRHQLWNVYKPPVFHLDYFEVIPIGGGRDFNAILKVCKGKCTHK
jgi:hypothetical protein